VRDLLALDLDECRPSGGAQRGQRGQLARCPVHRELDDVAVLGLLDAVGRQLQQLRQDQLGVGAADAERQPDHARSTRRSFANTPSSERRLSSVSVPCKRSSSSRCSSLRRRGITTLTITRRSPVGPRRSGGSPRPRSVTVSPGCTPAGSSISVAPSSVGTSTRVPSAAAGAGTSTAVTRSWPSRTKRSSWRTCTSTYR